MLRNVQPFATLEEAVQMARNCFSECTGETDILRRETTGKRMKQSNRKHDKMASFVESEVKSASNCIWVGVKYDDETKVPENILNEFRKQNEI